MCNNEDELTKLLTENAYLRKKNLDYAVSVDELLDEIDKLRAWANELIEDNEELTNHCDELIEENAELSELNNNLRGQTEFLDK